MVWIRLFINTMLFLIFLVVVKMSKLIVISVGTIGTLRHELPSGGDYWFIKIVV